MENKKPLFYSFPTQLRGEYIHLTHIENLSTKFLRTNSQTYERTHLYKGRLRQ